MAADTAIGSTITQALKAGSGVDINELATSLAEAESLPRINSVTKKIESSKVAISGMGVLKAGVERLRQSFVALEDKGSLLTKSLSTSNTNRVTAVISSQANASAGTTKLIVNSLARPQQNTISDNGDAFTSLTSSLASSDFTINLKVPHGTSGSGTTVTVSNHTPQGVIDAINSKTAITGVEARAANLLASGTTFHIILRGKTGALNSFEFSSSLSGSSALKGGDRGSATDNAGDLQVLVNDQLFKRDNNSPIDLIEGVQPSFKSAGSQTTNIVVAESSASLETSLKSMVEAYNNLIKLSDYLTGESDEEDEVAGSLSKDKATVNVALNKARSLINLSSSTASNGFTNLRDIGINTKLGGEVSLDAKVYAAALKTNFSDVRTMLTGDTNGQSANSASAKGLALDMSIILDSVVSDTGSITTKESAVQKKIGKYEEQLLMLEDRLESIKARYLKQFAAMETLVQRNKNTGEYLTSQFEAMQNSK